MWTRLNDFDRSLAVMDELRRRMNLAFSEVEGPQGYEETFTRTGYPNIALVDAGNALVLRAFVPGLAQGDVTLSIHQDVLSLAGERKSAVPEGYTVHRQERAATKFTRSFTLPCKVDAERTSAQLRDGVLTVTLPKAPEAQPRQIAVKAS